MSQGDSLTPEERAELEQLRAEKAARAEAAKQAAERAELERLRAEKDQAARAATQDAADAERRERGRKLMEPDDDDLKMPLGQKIVILCVVGIAIAWLLATVLVH